MFYEYSVVPAPKKGVKSKGVKTVEDRFAHALQEIMNEKGAAGWEYVRTDTLPVEERQGLTGRTTTYQNMMVFRRSAAPATESAEPPRALLAAPAPEADAETAPTNAAPIEPTFTSRSDAKMMTVETPSIDDDALRADPKLRTD